MWLFSPVYVGLLYYLLNVKVSEAIKDNNWNSFAYINTVFCQYLQVLWTYLFCFNLMKVPAIPDETVLFLQLHLSSTS